MDQGGASSPQEAAAASDEQCESGGQLADPRFQQQPPQNNQQNAQNQQNWERKSRKSLKELKEQKIKFESDRNLMKFQESIHESPR